MEEMSHIIGRRGTAEYQILYEEVMEVITKLDQYIGNGGWYVLIELYSVLQSFSEPEIVPIPDSEISMICMISNS